MDERAAKGEEAFQHFELVGKFDIRLGVAKVAKADKKMFDNDKFAWLAARCDGVWIVRMVVNNVVDHCIVVDGGRKIVLDSASRFPEMLTKELLCKTEGADVIGMRVASARRLYKQGKKNANGQVLEINSESS